MYLKNYPTLTESIRYFDSKQFTLMDPRKHSTASKDAINYLNCKTGVNMNFKKYKVIDKPIAKAKEQYLKNVNKCIVGHKYQFGCDGFPVDYEKAAYCFETAADNGSALGYLLLSQLYRNGKGVPQDSEMSLAHLLRAANRPLYLYLELLDDVVKDQAVIDAEYALGLCYETGLCTEKNVLEAVEWYEKAYEHGSGDAANSLGVIYMNGAEDIAKDLNKAESLLLRAIDEDIPNAKTNITALYTERD